MIKKTKHRTICFSDPFSITTSNVYRKASSNITNVLVDLHINFRFSGVIELENVLVLYYYHYYYHK